MNARKSPVRKSAVKKTTRKEQKTSASTTGSKRKKKTEPQIVTRKKDYSKNIKHIPVVDDTPGDGKVLILRNTMNVALASPFRYPIDYSHIAAQTARVSGMLFIVVGAFFTFYNINALNGFYNTSGSNYQALTTSSLNSGSTEIISEADLKTGLETNTLGMYPTTEEIFAETKPDVDLKLNAPDPDIGYALQRIDGTDTVKGTVDIHAQVEHAERVDAYVKSQNGDRIKIGEMTKVSADVWKLSWDTRSFSEGYHNLYVYVVNRYGTYEDGHEEIEIINATVEAPSEDASLLDADFSPAASITFNDSEPLEGDARIGIETEHAESVGIYVDGGFIGEAQQNNENEWRYTLDTKKLLNGTHSVFVRVSYSGRESYTSPKKSFVVENDDELSPAAETDTSADIALTEGAIMMPEVDVDVRASSPLHELVDVRIETEGAEFVELYALPKYSLGELFLGLASKVEPNRFMFTWNTRNSPNGEYAVFARVKNLYGYYASEKQAVLIQNESLTARTEEENSLVTVTEALYKTVEPLRETVTGQPQTVTLPETAADTEKDEAFNVQDRTRSLIEAFREEIDDELQRLASAIRSGDLTAVEHAKSRLEELRTQILESDLSDADGLNDRLGEELSTIFSDLLSRTEQAEVLVRERVGEAVYKDSDGDGITDYDEVTIYKTDLFTADTDKDGFIDSAEILNGFNPLDSESEVLVTYESPQETGVIRSDILEVEKIETAIKEEIESPKSVAIISGRGLPNSFVTLYIYSTPIVVTVKTADDGSWSYTFDKELEDGEHEVYVGITDNAGKIIARSNPLAFVKTAQAFTPVDAEVQTAAPAVDEAVPSFFSEYAILLILSISVIALGLVLLLLGIYISTPRHPKLLLQ